MPNEEDILYLYLLYRMYRRHRSKRQRRVWVNPANRERENHGIMPIYPRLVDDVEEFYVYTKMSPDLFDDLCAMVSPEIRKMNTNFREAIPPRDRLIMTLRFLSSGESFRSLSYQFHVGTSTIRKITYETCEAIWKRCQAKEIPKLEGEDFKRIGNDFEHRWDFPNCVGCIVGKKIRITSTYGPQRSDNAAASSKSKAGRRSIILQGVVDAHSNFVAIDVGDYESQGDSGPSIFRLTSFGKALMRNQVDLPEWNLREENDEDLPHVFISSINYPMLPRLLRPYPKRDLTLKRKLFNDKISHASKCSEIAFGALVDRWGILKSVMNMDPSQVCKVVRACCVLHNYVRHRAASSASTSSRGSCEEDVDDVLDILPPVTKAMVGRPSEYAMGVRDAFADFFYRTQPPPASSENTVDESQEPLLELELECQEDDSVPMEEQENSELEEDGLNKEFNCSGDEEDEEEEEDMKVEDCLNVKLKHAKTEHDDAFFQSQSREEADSHETTQGRSWPESSETGRSEVGEQPYPVLQCPAGPGPGDVHPLEDADSSDREIDVKPEIVSLLKCNTSYI